MVSKNFKKVSNEISFLVNAAIASAKIKKLVFEEPEKIYSARPPLHLILSAPVGAAKSTVMEQIAGISNTPIITEATKAGLVGTLDSKTYQAIPGAAWEQRNSLLLMDEFTFGKKKEGWQVFLQLLETQKWSKRIGIFSSKTENTDGDLHYRSDKGCIDMKTRFSCIVATMKKYEFQRGQDFRAFVSRCIPYNFTLAIDDLDAIANGRQIFRYVDFKPQQEFTVRKTKYMQIKRIILKELKKLNTQPWLQNEIFLRTVGDCCRIHAATGKNSIGHFRSIIAWKAKTQELIGKYYIKVTKNT